MQLPNGAYATFINNGGQGSTIGPVLVRDYHNGTVAANADFYATKPSGSSFPGGVINLKRSHDILYGSYVKMRHPY
jgi:hypothetical protein